MSYINIYAPCNNIIITVPQMQQLNFVWTDSLLTETQVEKKSLTISKQALKNIQSSYSLSTGSLSRTKVHMFTIKMRDFHPNMNFWSSAVFRSKCIYFNYKSFCNFSSLRAIKCNYSYTKNNPGVLPAKIKLVFSFSVSQTTKYFNRNKWGFTYLA